jgi:aryl-alcohol dehydrogenase-like predicted oxidoreductase
MPTRTIFPGSTIPALGLGCWAIGGPFSGGDTPLGWGDVDDAVSRRAIATALDLGVRFFDTAPAYGAGHSETVLGEALAGRQDALVSTKVGYDIDPGTRRIVGETLDPDAIEAQIDASLRRLRRETIDLAFLHLNEAPLEAAAAIFARLSRLREAGKIRAFGWSTDYPERAAALPEADGAVAIQHAMNVFFRAEALLPVIERRGLLSVNRSPLAMGLLAGKYARGSRMPADDVRGQTMDWMDYFKDGEVAPAYAAMLDAVRDLLRADGRTLVQGALGWLWARSSRSLPIPGFRTETQVREIAGALEKGPLPDDVIAEIERVIDRPAEGDPRAR